MTVLDEAWFATVVSRLLKLMAAFTGAGIAVGFFWRGWNSAAGFALGAAISWLNFRWLKKLTEAVGRPGGGGTRSAVFLGLRYLLLGGGAYVILRYSSISLAAALAGLFVPVAAVIVEILFELVYARH